MSQWKIQNGIKVVIIKIGNTQINSAPSHCTDDMKRMNILFGIRKIMRRCSLGCLVEENEIKKRKEEREGKKNTKSKERENTKMETMASRVHAMSVIEISKCFD